MNVWNLYIDALLIYIGICLLSHRVSNQLKEIVAELRRMNDCAETDADRNKTHRITPS